MELNLDNTYVLVGVIYAGIIVVVFWLAMIVWAYRDMKARSRDSLAQIFVAIMVGLLNIPGIFAYMMLRPRETLSEAYERSLEEEALLQEIEEKPTCPGCSRRVHDDWQACPYCHTRLKKACIVCNRMLELSWNLCPHCATSQMNYAEEQAIRSRHIRQREGGTPEIPQQWMANSEASSYSSAELLPPNDLEFVDD